VAVMHAEAGARLGRGIAEKFEWTEHPMPPEMFTTSCDQPVEHKLEVVVLSMEKYDALWQAANRE
jgi:hypothetical protein